MRPQEAQQAGRGYPGSPLNRLRREIFGGNGLLGGQWLAIAAQSRWKCKRPLPAGFRKNLR